MAPFVAKSTRSGIVVKPGVRKKFPSREQTSETTDMYEDSAPAMNGQSSQLDISDLQEVAERVGKEVDVFAETVDQLKDQLFNAASQREAALQLCLSFQAYATEEARRLVNSTRVQRAQDARDGFARRGQSNLFGRAGSTAVVLEDDNAQKLKQLQAEVDTWDLLRAVLGARYPSEHESTTLRSKLDTIGQPHRYTSQEHVWQHFILTNDVAKERQLVVRWLESSMDRRCDALAQADDSAGLWTNGWMETRERIKASKRMRIGQDGPLQVRSADGTGLLVSNLDPDAPARQKRRLEKGDVSSERAMWIAIYHLLRRGSSWSEVVRWCEERNQGWQAVSLGQAGRQQLPGGPSSPALGVLWRKMCLVAARAETADEYEAAAYGLLGGDLESVKTVARCWDDHVYAYFNNLLIAQYDEHLQRLGLLKQPADHLSRKLPGTEQAGDPTTTSQQILQGLANNPKLAFEASSAIKLIQSNLISNTVHDLCIQVGAAIVDAAWKEEPSAVIKPIHRFSQRVQHGVSPAAAISDNPDTLRIMTHVLIIMRAIEPTSFSSSTGDRDGFDNIIAGYIQLLRVAGKRDMTPLYASLMAEDRCIASLAQAIADNQDSSDAMAFIRLMNIYNVDTVAVIKAQYAFQLDRVLNVPPTAGGFAMLEKTKEDLYPGQRVMLHGLSIDTLPDEEALVDGLSLYFLVEGHWSDTFEALASACGKLLAEKHFAAARRLVEELAFEQLSYNKSKSILGFSINVMDRIEVAEHAKSRQAQHQVRLLQRESQKYFDMTLLVRAVGALEAWREVEHEFAHRIPRPVGTPHEVKKALADVTACIDPLLAGIMVEAANEEEAKTFATIRATYLPEIILAYITVLCTAGHMVSRGELLTAMDLSTIIASKEQQSNGLAQAFLDAGRMKELVEMFARTSKIMLKLNETGKVRREKRGNAGKTLSIWEING